MIDYAILFWCMFGGFIVAVCLAFWVNASWLKFHLKQVNKIIDELSEFHKKQMEEMKNDMKQVIDAYEFILKGK